MPSGAVHEARVDGTVVQVLLQPLRHSTRLPKNTPYATEIAIVPPRKLRCVKSRKSMIGLASEQARMWTQVDEDPSGHFFSLNVCFFSECTLSVLARLPNSHDGKASAENAALWWRPGS